MSGASSQLSAFNYAVQPLGNLQIKNITAAYTVSPSDSNFILNCNSTASFTISMPPASSLPSGFNFTVWNTGTTTGVTVTIDPNGAETIDFLSTLSVQGGEGIQVVCNGLSWNSGSQKLSQLIATNKLNNGARPIASGERSVAIGANSTASGTFSHTIGYICTASNTNDSAFGYNSSASGGYSLAISGVASASNSTAIGLNSGLNKAQAVTGSGAMALGGSYASGADSFAAGVTNNTSTYGATGANSIALGYQNIASSAYANAVGSSNSVTTTSGHTFGNTNTVAGTGLAIGRFCEVGSLGGMAIGSQARADGFFKLAFSSGSFVSAGDSQTGTFVLSSETTGATPTVLTMGNSGLVARQIILPNNSAYSFSGTIISRQKTSNGSNYAAWEVKGAILRDANAASTVLGSYNINVLSKTAGASAWDLTLSADTTNGGLAVTATGAASVNIRWVATIKTSEVTYA